MTGDLSRVTKLLVTADWHLRYDVPACRKMSQPEWIQHQRNSLQALKTAAKDAGAVVCCIGDIFHRAKEDVAMIPVLLDTFGPEELAILPGNHDAPYHSLDHLDRSNYGVLRRYYMELDRCPSVGGRTLRAFQFGAECESSAEIVCTHQLTFKDAQSKPAMAEGATAQDHLARWPHAQWIFCGDNHTPFTYALGGRRVLNPGCLNRQSASVASVRPRAYLVDLLANTAQVVHLPDPGEVEDRAVAEEIRLDEKVVAFLERLHNGKQAGALSFVDQLRSALQSEALAEATKRVGLQLLEELNKEK